MIELSFFKLFLSPGWMLTLKDTKIISPGQCWVLNDPSIPFFLIAICGISVPWPLVEASPLAVKAKLKSLDHQGIPSPPIPKSTFPCSWGLTFTLQDHASFLDSWPWWWWFSHQVMSDSCDPMDCSLPGSSVHGILQARILEWVAISSPGDLPNPGIEPGSPALQADSLPTKLQGKILTILVTYCFITNHPQT